MPIVRLLVATLAALALSTTVALPSAHAATVGMSDGRPVLFDSPHLRELEFQHVRLVLPWDAALREGTWTTWLARASAQRWPILIAPNRSTTTPTAAQYESALRLLLERYPTIDAVAGWNEPNHSIQPTAGKPALAAAYFDAVHRACAGRCTAVAGNLLDAPSMGGYLSAYRAALTTRPAVWGLHNYYDTTYFQRSGIDQMLAVTDAPIWLTETGGLVSFQPNGPGTGLLPDERRAADGLRWLFSIVAREPRIARVYLYGMWQEPWNAFDSALLRVDNAEREGMAVVRGAIGPRTTPLPGTPNPSPHDPGSGGATTGQPRDGLTNGAAQGGMRPTPQVLRLVGKRISVNRSTRRATVTMRCVLGPCTGQLRVRAGRWSYRRSVMLPAGARRVVTVRLSRTALRGVRGTPTTRNAARICAGGACSSVPLVRR